MYNHPKQTEMPVLRKCHNQRPVTAEEAEMKYHKRQQSKTIVIQYNRNKIMLEKSTIKSRVIQAKINDITWERSQLRAKSSKQIEMTVIWNGHDQIPPTNRNTLLRKGHSQISESCKQIEMILLRKGHNQIPESCKQIEMTLRWKGHSQRP